MEAVSPKDSVNPASGCSHATRSSYLSLEKQIPHLEENYEKIICQIMWLVHQKAELNHRCQKEAKVAAAAGGSSKSTTTPEITCNPLPAVSQGKTSGSRGSKKIKMKKQQKRQKMEKLCDGYKLLEGDQGLVIEDEKGVPLLIVVRNMLTKDHNVGTFDISLLYVEFRFLLQEALTGAASEFSNNFKPTKTSTFREEYKEVKDSPFQCMGAHFSLWWQIGHPVSFILPSKF